ncbi:DnaJ-domain-containing protein [Yamadazyma tenuis ATCC 10573]|uniref:DnaJ-domain-containing protein n=1 Tax=Candida tenuis (strain ATCC 10573 / BCRC 21748 / CBS 615 / JCM 9827 / NBRC 10315 / NRRL Y-1498 / VKM Y-70) TaxID=590646 RepID=G3AW60_CANTC|nr:DnaJ-domain-containing protein [Yamadazyma tenuis ATCC 10573]EGV66460.1 DnaJ-domain-containing protein [Yamadazyma tenuis ATCC 10573]
MHFFILLLVASLLALAQAKDYYKILDIGKDADDKTVKSAYRRLSKLYHPDKNPSEEAHERFIEVGEAYDVLSDPQKKKNYDTYGDPNAQPDNRIDLGDLFSQFFGGGGGGGGPMGGRGGGGNARRVRKGENKLAAVDVPLKDFYTGIDLNFSLQMKAICSGCEGSGSKDKQRHPCTKCGGQGIVQMRRQLGPGMIQTFQVQCDECGGKGTVIKHKCSRCHGAGVEDVKKDFSIYLPAGLERNHHSVIEGEGDENPDWTPGDVIVNIQEDFKDTWGYRRVGHNLYRTEVLTLAEALEGNWSRTIPFFDPVDPEIHLSRHPQQVVVNNEVEVIKGRGMPFVDDDDSHGDLFIEYKILVPETPGAPEPRFATEIAKDEL